MTTSTAWQAICACEVEEKVDREKTREAMARNRTGCLDPMAWVYAVQTMVRRRR